MFWSSFLSIARKEVLHMTRDASTLRFAVIMPIFQLGLFGSLDTTVRNLPTVVVDQDRSTASREIIDGLRASGTLSITHVTSNEHEARDEMAAGTARVGVVIPPDFHDATARGSGADLLVLIDGSDSTASAQALGAVNGLVSQRNLARVQKTGLAPPLSAHPIILYNPDGRTANFIIPGLVAVLLQMAAIALASSAIVRERERGTLEQLLVTPIDPMGLVLGKLFPYLFFGLFQMGMILFIMRFAFGVVIRGSLPFLFLIATLYLVALLAMALFVSSRAATQQEAFQVSQLIVLPSIFLSGYIFPFAGLPKILQVIGLCLPATHMIAIMRGVVLREANLAQMLPHVLALIAMSVILIGVSVRGFRKVTG